MTGIFISHADSALAVALDRLLRKALGNKLTVFNSSRAATGLGAGQPIDSTLLSHIRMCDAFIWLTSPESARRSFWMAWELGAAEATERSIYPCRALGMDAASLPLLQSRRYVPDLGEREDLEQFLQDVASGLSVEDTAIPEAIGPFYENYPIATPFDATLEPSEVLEVTIAGKRLVVENRSDASITRLRFESAGEQAGPGTANGAASLLDALRVHDQLGPTDRRLVSLRDTTTALEALERSQLIARWVDAATGRRAQRVEVRLHR